MLLLSQRKLSSNVDEILSKAQERRQNILPQIIDFEEERRKEHMCGCDRTLEKPTKTVNEEQSRKSAEEELLYAIWTA